MLIEYLLQRAELGERVETAVVGPADFPMGKKKKLIKNNVRK